MLDGMASDIVEKIVDELDDRSMFNGIDDDVKSEIVHTLYEIVLMELL